MRHSGDARVAAPGASCLSDADLELQRTELPDIFILRKVKLARFRGEYLFRPQAA